MQNSLIPFLDLITPHRELEEELLSGLRCILQSGAFVGGHRVEQFEKEFAGFCEARHCVGVGSGTDALRFALIACGVQAGDLVITVPNTFIATTEAISQSGALPDFVDIQEHSYNIDPQKLADKLEKECRHDRLTGKLIHKKTGRRLAAIIPVHLYGRMADLDPILELAAEYRLIVVEDACQAHGAEYFSRIHNRWVRAGSLGHAAAFSFYPGKNLGACGEAGAVITNDPEAAKKARILRDHGQVKKYCHEIEGYNGRLDAFQAAVLHTKLKYLPSWTRQRRENASRYNQLFASAGVPVTVPSESPRFRSVHHVYAIRVKDRDALQAHLAHENIATQVHYPIPLHLQRAYAYLNYRNGDFPVTETVATELLSLPLYPHLRLREQKRVVRGVVEFLSRKITPSTVYQTAALPEYRAA